MMVGSTAKAKTFSGLLGSPSGPKTSVEPSAAWPSMRGDCRAGDVQDGLAVAST